MDALVSVKCSMVSVQVVILSKLNVLGGSGDRGWRCCDRRDGTGVVMVLMQAELV